MKEFLGTEWGLNSKTAVALYNDYARACPIFDFHCHLNPQEIADDKKFDDLVQVWLSGDHYKWRLMREMGIDEKYVSGNASGYDKFLKYASIIPYAIGNPLYVWTHLELRRFFGIERILNAATAPTIWNEANNKLKSFSAQGMIKHCNVKALFTTDDPTHNLQAHQDIAKSEFGSNVKVAPAFRPDKVININSSGFLDYIARLSTVSKREISTLNDLKIALISRIEYFALNNCVCSDHALDTVPNSIGTDIEAEKVFIKSLNGQELSSIEVDKYRSNLLVFFAREYTKRNWVQQYHIGAIRNASSLYFKTSGADTGYDCINDTSFAINLVKILDELQLNNCLPKTILYCLNPRDNEVLATVKNCFSQQGVIAKIQFGSAWWFNDQKDGIKKQMTALSQVGLLSKFVGMLTDSRSFLSYPRHEFFRRILCDMLGELIEQGDYPNDIDMVGQIVQDICYNNSVHYFGLQ